MLNTLNVAQTGLSVANTQVENVMNNISNENTTGYKKRVVSTGELELSDSRLTGRGAYVQSVDRITNIYMYDNLMKQTSKDAQHTELSTMLDDIQSIFYETEDSGFSNDLDKYFQSIEDLRSNPHNEIYKNNLINQGQILVDDLQTLYKGIEDREKITTNFVNDNIEEINGILNDIGDVNKRIADKLVPPNDLLDKRDNLEARLSKYIKIDVDRADTYALNVGNMTAVRYDTNIHAIDVNNTKIKQKDIYAKDEGATSNISTLINKTTWGGTDTVTYTLDKDHSVTVTNGEIVNGKTVDKDSIVQALVYKINNDPTLSNYIEAHNGQYSVDEDGNKVEQLPTNVDHFLLVESKIPGIDGKFESRIIVDDDNNTDAQGNQVSNLSLKSSIKSVEANNDIYLEIFAEELDISGGSMKSMLDNIDTTSTDNKFTKYKKMLDNFAKTLSDMSQAYIDNGNGTYVSGEQNSILHKDKAKMKTIGLFDGASVETLKFNKATVVNMDQEDLDYLATLQWNENINIDGTNQNNTSFSKYLQTIKVAVSADKQNVDYAKETQKSVMKSLQNTYDKYTKVNKDDEMINLIKYQAAYEANAKLVTLVDEMLQTILGMKR